MEITLTQAEVDKAITAYLRANAAVDVASIEYSRKAVGLVATVSAEIVSPDQYLYEPDIEESFVPADEKIYRIREEELIDDEPIVVEEEAQLELPLPEPEVEGEEVVDIPEVVEEVVEVVEQPEPVVSPIGEPDRALALMDELDEEEEDTEVETAPVVEPPKSIAELLGQL